jgi:TPR repeat protein
MYLDGVGVARDAIEAYVLFTVAAEKGVSSARPRRIQAKRGLSAAQLARAKKLAVERLAKLKQVAP